MIGFLNRRRKMFKGIVCVMIYSMVGFPISNAINDGTSVVFTLFQLGWARAANLRDVRTGKHEKFTRVVFEFQDDVRYENPEIKGMGKFSVVFLDSSTTLPSLTLFKTGRIQPVHSIEFVRQKSNLTANVRLSFPHFILKSFSLSNPNRIVVDVYQVSSPPEKSEQKESLRETPIIETPTSPEEKELKHAPQNALDITPQQAEETLNLSEKEKEKLVEQGVAQYQQGELKEAKKTFEYAKEVFPANFAVPYYLGLIYLEEGRRSDAISEWKQYVLMDPESEDSLKIRKYLTLLIREEAVDYAKQAVANEAALLGGPVDDNTVAVTTFKNLGSENLGPLGKGMEAMLIHDLSQVPDLQVVERVKIQALLQEMNLGTTGLVDQRTAPKVGKLLKSKHVTTGSLADLEKENLQIVSVVVDTEKIGSMDTQEAQGALKKFYELEKEIACGIIEDLGRDCSKMPGAFGRIHTKSLAALSAYSVGLDYLDQEKYDEARGEFQKAIDEDPDFDLAKEALVLTPLSAMALMTTANMISSLSASGASSATIGSAAAGTAVVGGGGVGVAGITTAVVVGAAAVGGIAAAGGGGGDDGGGNVSPNLTGAWVGTWTSSTGTNGSISLDLIQAEGSTSVNGSATVTGTDCTFGGTISGTVSGNNFQANISGTGSASFDATATTTSINGTLEITSTTCTVNAGNFSSTITGSATITWPVK